MTFVNNHNKIKVMNNIKGQDILILLKLLVKEQQLLNWNYQAIADELIISLSQVHTAIKRLQKSYLLNSDTKYPIHSSMREFLVHGLRYCFPPEYRNKTRGIPTGYSAKPLQGLISSGNDLPPVWPHPEGDTKGIALTPLYKSVPEAALKDPELYRLLALADMLRSGNARERKIATGEFENILL